MKLLVQSRLLSVLLCMAMTLSLTTCSGQGRHPAENETSDTAGTLSGRKENLYGHL